MRILLLLVGLIELLWPAVEIADAGSITGNVGFVESPPKLEPVKVSKDQDYCGETLPNETYLVDANDGLKNAVVFIDSRPIGNARRPSEVKRGRE